MAEPASAQFLRLLDLAREHTPEARGRLVDSLGAFVVDRTETHSPKEQALAADILRKLLHDTEITVRKRLAERLGRERDAPFDLVVELARDDAEVARAVLLESDVLHDAQLVEVIEQKTMQHRLAIAMRRQVSEAVSAALVDSGEDDVACTLLENPGAKIGRDSFEKLVERSRRSTPLHEPLLRRHDLEPELAGRMYAWVSAALRRHIVQHFDVDPKLLDRAIEDSLDAVAADHAKRAAEGGSDDRIAAALVERRDDDPSLLLNLLRAGEVALFEAMFARLTALKPTLARRAIYEPGGRALAVACRASGIEKPIYAAIFLLARKARPGDKSVDPKELPAALAFFDSLNEAAAANMLDTLRTAGEARRAHA